MENLAGYIFSALIGSLLLVIILSYISEPPSFEQIYFWLGGLIAGGVVYHFIWK